MQWFINYLGFEQVFQQRNHLLDQQERQDKLLQACVATCPKEVAEYLLWTRQENRRMTREYNHTGVSGYMTLIHKHMRQVQHQQAVLDENQKYLCHAFKQPDYFLYMTQKTPPPPCPDKSMLQKFK